MHRFILLSVLTTSWFAAAGALPAEPLHVLFIGNSYTFVNDLPGTLAALAEAGGGAKIEYEQVTPGGCTLEKHFKNGNAVKKIQARKWDVVVLQEHSLMPVDNPQLMHEYARKLHVAIQPAGSKIVFYLTWARHSNPAMQTKLNSGYFQIAKELNATVAPVGIAWQRALTADPKRILHSKDGSHPNPAGTYLAACVFYATLLDKNPEGLPATAGKIKLDATEANQLQTIAWQTVQDLKRGKLPVSTQPNSP